MPCGSGRPGKCRLVDRTDSGSVANSVPMPHRDLASFATDHIQKRMAGFTKDIRICLKLTRHPAGGKPTAAYSPALATCCATLEYLTGMFTGRRNGPNVDFIVKYAKRYLPQPDYSRDILEILFDLFRHAVAHRGIVSGVMVHERSGRRIAWRLSTGASKPAIQVVADPGQDPRAPWPCSFTHRAHIHLDQLGKDIAQSGASYAADVASSDRLLQNFAKYMEVVFPRNTRRQSRQPPL